MSSEAKKGLTKLLKKQPKNLHQKYTERLDYELSVIKKMGFASYFLITADFVQYAKKNIRSNSVLPGPIDTSMQERWRKNPIAKKNLKVSGPIAEQPVAAEGQEQTQSVIQQNQNQAAYDAE